MLDHEEHINPPILFADCLIKTTLSSPVGFSKYQSIDLGTIGREAEGLLSRVNQDPNRLERGKLILVTAESKLLIQTKDNVGRLTANGQEVGGSVTLKVKLNRTELPRDKKQQQYLGADIHVHPDDESPSPKDLINLLATENDIELCPALLIISPVQKTLYLRSISTPQFDKRRRSVLLAKWENELFQPSRAVSLDLKYFFNPQLKRAQTQLIVFELIHRICQEYAIHQYSCPVNTNIVKPYSA